jgi:hypothetical protein
VFPTIDKRGRAVKPEHSMGCSDEEKNIAAVLALHSFAVSSVASTSFG